MSASQRVLERGGPLQPDLFSGTQVLERVLAGSQTVVRLRLRWAGSSLLLDPVGATV